MPKTGLFIGRFQPFHLGHLATVRYALTKVETLVVVVGSAQKSYEPRNPFTSGERLWMIKEALDSETEIDAKRILIIPVPDVDVHSSWAGQIDMLVPRYDLVVSNDSFTLMLFRERAVKVVEAPLYKRSQLSGTEIRNLMARGDERWKDFVPASVERIVREINGIERVKAIAEKGKDSHH
ncbi:MAG: nicotinamide-nucleotide adenylyltransferase [Nitrososphaera sp.]